MQFRTEQDDRAHNSCEPIAISGISWQEQRGSGWQGEAVSVLVRVKPKVLRNTQTGRRAQTIRVLILSSNTRSRQVHPEGLKAGCMEAPSTQATLATARASLNKRHSRQQQVPAMHITAPPCTASQGGGAAYQDH